MVIMGPEATLADITGALVDGPVVVENFSQESLKAVRGLMNGWEVSCQEASDGFRLTADRLVAMSDGTTISTTTAAQVLRQSHILNTREDIDSPAMKALIARMDGATMHFHRIGEGFSLSVIK